MTNPWGNPQPFDPNQPGIPSAGSPDQAGPAGYGYPPPSYPGAGNLYPPPPSYSGADNPYPAPYPNPAPYPSGYPAPPSGYPGYPPAGYPTPDHPRAATAMILGILGLVCCGLASPFAVWTGRKAIRDIDASGGLIGGRGQAQAGFVLGIIGTALWVLLVALYAIAAVAAVSTSGTRTI
jgi:hypothetical protein